MKDRNLPIGAASALRAGPQLSRVMIEAMKARLARFGSMTDV